MIRIKHCILMITCMTTLCAVPSEKNEKITITNVVIPAAGLGTRFLPYTKATAKELVPLMEKPAIQFIIEEAINSGITTCTIIINNDKQAIKNYFSCNNQLEEHLKSKNKTDLIKDISDIIASTQFIYAPQPEPLGLGHAVLMAEHIIGNNYFGVMLPDAIMMGDSPVIGEMIAIAQKYNASVIGVQEVSKSKISSHASVVTRKELSPGVFEIDYLIEKPKPEEAPSCLATMGRYVLSPRIFESIKAVKPGAGNEIQLTDAIADMIKKGERVLAYVIKADRYDTGNPIGWFKANLAYCLRNEKYASIIKEYIKNSIKDN